MTPALRKAILMMHLTDRCNLDCHYCYAGKSAGTMSLETARKSVDFLAAYAPNHPNALIDFIGGEPLMAPEVLKWTVDYAKTKGIKRFGVTTNGTPIDKAWMEYMAAERFALHISVDGIGADHDKNRKFFSGKGSFERLDKIQDELGPYGKDLLHYEVRYTFTPNNIPNLADTVAYFGSKDITRYGWVIIMPAMLPTGQWQPMIDAGTLVPALREQFDKIADLCIRRLAEERPLHICYNDCLENSPSLSLWDGITTDSCRAGREFLTVNMEGDLYPCHIPGSHPNYSDNLAQRIGHIDRGITRPEGIDKFCGSEETGCHSCHHWNRLETGDGGKVATVYKALYIAWLEAGRKIQAFRKSRDGGRGAFQFKGDVVAGDGRRPWHEVEWRS